MTNDERVIKFLNDKFQYSDNNIVSINKTDLPTIGLSEKEAVQSLYILREDRFLDFVQKSVHDDFSMFWKVSLKSKCIHYFETKQENKKARHKEIWKEIRAWATLAVAIIALFVSIFSSCSKTPNPSSAEVPLQEAAQSDIVTTPQMSDGDAFPTTTN